MATPFQELQARLRKPARGSARLDREAKRQAIEAHERRVFALVKKRDGWACRWPESKDCRGNLEGAHLDAKGMGGDHGLRTETYGVIALCAWHHRAGPISLHGQQIRIECETPAGADGPVSFWRWSEDGWYLVARERRIGLLERD